MDSDDVQQDGPEKPQETVAEKPKTTVSLPIAKPVSGKPAKAPLTLESLDAQHQALLKVLRKKIANLGL
jgi:hypothetical protein